jgi:hypothetical protein
MREVRAQPDHGRKVWLLRGLKEYPASSSIDSMMQQVGTIFIMSPAFARRATFGKWPLPGFALAVLAFHVLGYPLPCIGHVLKHHAMFLASYMFHYFPALLRLAPTFGRAALFGHSRPPATWVRLADEQAGAGGFSLFGSRTVHSQA